MNITGIVIGILGLIFAFVFWRFPFNEISENESFVQLITTINENLLWFILFASVFLILSLALLLSNKKKENTEKTIKAMVLGRKNW